MDPVCHKIGSSLYGGIIRAIIGTHISTWRRENERIQKDQPDKELSLLTILTKNRMI